MSGPVFEPSARRAAHAPARGCLEADGALDFVEMGDPARILEEALDLSPDERAHVARALIDSLDSSSDEGADSLWEAEVRARLDAVAAGTVALEDWDTVRDRLRAKSNNP